MLTYNLHLISFINRQSFDRGLKSIFLGGIGMSSLSSYKPSTLLVEIPDNNIDNKLGVKNLVVQSRNPPPTTKPRITIEHWSANNGSIIYAQPSSLKNGFNSYTNGFCERNKLDFRKQQEESQTSRVNGTTDQTEIDSCPSGAPVNGARMQIPTMLPLNARELRNKSPQNQDSHINGLHSRKNLISPPNNHLHDPQYNAKSMTDNPIQSHLGEDLNHSSSTNWSNGTCRTSDLLF